MDPATLPPARASVDDPAIDWLAALRTDVMLDGAKVAGCTAYDCEEGWVERHVLDERGNPVLTDDRERVAIERLTGTVTVAWKAS